MIAFPSPECNRVLESFSQAAGQETNNVQDYFINSYFISSD